MKLHIVQKGDTLWKIAKKYGVNFEELKKMNAQLSNPDMIMPGMKIKVPTGGGSIKKEAPQAGGTSQAKINMGGKKEMPISEHPFAKEKPKPVQEKKEAPKVEAPKEAPIKELPKKEEPKPAKKEEEVKPFIPKMPKPIKPEIDIQNYYMMNMTNMQLPPQPQLPPKPDNIFPEIKPEVKPEVKPVKQQIKPQAKAETKPKAKSEIKPDIKIQKNEYMEEPASMLPLSQGGYPQSMIPYPYCYPGGPSIYGPGYGSPWAPQAMPYQQVQGASQYPGMMPNMPMSMEDMESSSFDQQLPINPSANEGFPQMTGPTYYGVPISPVMPGPGWYPPSGQMHNGYPPPRLPQQVGGMMDPQMMQQMGGMMPNQMPQQVGGMMDPQMMQQMGGMMDPQMMQQMGGMMDPQMMQQMGGMMDPQMMQQMGGMMPNQMPQQVGGMMDPQMMQQMGGMMPNQMPPQVGGMMEDESSEMPMPQMPSQQGGMMDQKPPQVGGMMKPNMPKQPGMGSNMASPYMPMNPGLHPMQQPYWNPMNMPPYPGFPMGAGMQGSMNDNGVGAMGSGWNMPDNNDESDES